MQRASSYEADARAAALMAWLQGLPVHTDVESLRPASADASFRRYFRVDAPGQPSGTLIAMDAPPDREDLRPFLYVAQLLRQAGLNAPAVLAADPQQGFALLSDLGTQTYLSVINERNADALFRDAIGALVRWQSATRADVLPPYDEALLQRELALYPEWYVARHLGVSLTAPQRATLDQQFRLLVQSALAQPRVFVHRDYMPRNLMVSDPNPGILDFQDAVCGPISYDIVSLLRDAFVSWEEERVLDWAIRYWEAARAAALPVPSDFAEFYRAFEWMGVQRHLKVLGIFARLRYRDGKPQYLEDAPRFVGYVRAVAHRYVGLAPLARLVDALEGIETRVSYTF